MVNHSSIPRLVIAGTQSGAGKTSITLGMVAALCRRGLKVQTFKVGPDYLDPTYLALASGRPCYNLDSWMTGEAYVKDLVRRVSKDADIAIIEGVMGLFDGADPAGLEGSTAQIALWLQAPVALVVDAHGMSRSFAAVAHGFSTFLPELRIGGIIANRCGSERHAQWLGESLKSAGLAPLNGAVMRGGLPELRSRHLGLVSADRQVLSRELLDQLADAVEGAVGLDGLLQLAASAGALNSSGPEEPEQEPKQEQEQQSPSVRLGIAQDEAFAFYYPDNLRALEQAGCELVPFSPLHDSELPPGLNGLYLGGGYPEEHVEQLAANHAMLDSIREFARQGAAIYAECGGLMYLSEAIQALDGKEHLLLGILPAKTRMRQRRQRLGYVEVTIKRDCPFGRTQSACSQEAQSACPQEAQSACPQEAQSACPQEAQSACPQEAQSACPREEGGRMDRIGKIDWAGLRLRGHEFHYSELASLPMDWERAYEIRYRRCEEPVAEGFLRGRVLASYVHLHFASQPGVAEHFANFLRKPIP